MRLKSISLRPKWILWFKVSFANAETASLLLHFLDLPSG